PLIASASGSRGRSCPVLVSGRRRKWFRIDAEGVQTMPAIGYVKRQKGGSFKGQIKTLTIRAEVDIVPNKGKANDNQPDYRVSSGDVEIGAGWSRHSEASGNDYVSLSLAAPEFGSRRLYANLGRAAGGAEDEFALIWNPAD